MTENASNIDAMRDVDVRTVDRASLVDLRDVPINTELSRQERLSDYIKRIRNPFCYKYGNIVVKESFANNGRSIEDCLEQYIGTLV
jgi:hypothetical protein